MIPFTPKSHILAATSIAAVLGLSIGMLPSHRVQTEMHTISLDLNRFDEPASETPLDARDLLQSQLVSIATPKEKLRKNETIQYSVVSGDTLSTIFSKLDIPVDDLNQVISTKGASVLARLRVGQVLDITYNETGSLSRLVTKLNSLESIDVTRAEKGFDIANIKVKPIISEAFATGEIETSLFLAGQKAGLSDRMLMSMANAFAYDIDFGKDLKPGDTFSVLYEEKLVDGNRVGTGNVLAAIFNNGGKTYTAIRYEDKYGSVAFYNDKGNSLKKAFLRTPVDFSRISSRFSNGRRHPILNKIRAHKGVDYAAATGTPIKTTGNGVISYKGFQSGYGNIIIVKHPGGYQTFYAHMNGFAKGMHQGKRVAQGQTIGYVGMTGLATGPHLHYEFRVNGIAVDPMSKNLPMSQPLEGEDRQRFLRMSKPIIAKLERGVGAMYAMNTRD